MRVTPLIPLFPLVGAAVLLLTGRRWRGASAGWLASLMVGASFVAAVVSLVSLVGEPAESRVFVQHLWDWVPVGAFQAGIDFRLDPLSMVMALTVSGVGALIHVYSIDYMHG